MLRQVNLSKSDTQKVKEYPAKEDLKNTISRFVQSKDNDNFGSVLIWIILHGAIVEDGDGDGIG